jgi:hypothetical protein
MLRRGREGWGHNGVVHVNAEIISSPSANLCFPSTVTLRVESCCDDAVDGGGELFWRAISAAPASLRGTCLSTLNNVNQLNPRFGHLFNHCLHTTKLGQFL